VLSEAKKDKKVLPNAPQKPESAVKSPKTKIHVEVARNISSAVENKLGNPSK